MLLQLDKIKFKTCPECGAGAVSSRQEKKHVNGHWNEYRKFECGLNLHFSPNFMRIEVEEPCKNSKEFIDKALRKNQAKEKIINYISKLEVDKEFQDQLKTLISGAYVK